MHAAGIPIQITLLTASQPVDSLSISDEGLQFIYVHEAQRGVSDHLHWPGGRSGVTLGPGYDMSGRSAEQIAKDLISVGILPTVAKQIGNGASGLTRQKAADYADDNEDLVNLSQQQEMKLLALLVPAYQDDVKDLIDVDLSQTQFDALVSFDYNCGPGHTAKVARRINKGEIGAAMKEMKKVNTSGGKIMPGLISRRDHEVTLYLYGKYAKHAK
jgi:GH24 family phage-related lysozyme (muramidase)